MDLISLLVYIVIAALIFYLVYWIIGQIPMPDPFKTVVLVIVGLIAVIFLISILTGWAPVGRFNWR
jgi:cytochrome c biogenesis factor